MIKVTVFYNDGEVESVEVNNPQVAFDLAKTGSGT